MKNPILFPVAFGLAIVSILLFMAGQPRFDSLPPSSARFLGTAAVLVSGLFWVLWVTSGRKKQE
jgi:hypothetical protein